MSGEGTTPPIVLDEHTRRLIENLVQSGVQSALVARAADRPRADANADAQGEHPVAGSNEIAGTSGTTAEVTEGTTRVSLPTNPKRSPVAKPETRRPTTTRQ
jgi:hypothetical protein